MKSLDTLYLVVSCLGHTSLPLNVSSRLLEHDFEERWEQLVTYDKHIKVRFRMDVIRL